MSDFIETTVQTESTQQEAAFKVNPGFIKEASTHSTTMNNDFGALLDINVTLTVELGGKVIKLKELLAIQKNEVIELNKDAGKLLDIKANNKLIAKGEVVVSNGRYGVRIIELVNNAGTVMGSES